MPSRPEPAFTFENASFSDANKKRNPPGGTLLPWPVSLEKIELSPFLPGKQLSLFPEDDEIDVAALRKKEAQRAAQQHAEGTRRAYESGWKDFQAFCQKTARAALPALPRTITLYLTYESTQGLATATITRRLVAISDAHKRAGHPTPCADPEVRDCLKKIRRDLGTAPKPKLPIWPGDLKAMLEAAGNGTRALRDRAVMLTGFASGLRRAELVALDLCDVTTESQGLRIRILRSKTDQEAAGAEVGVHRGQHKATCPVRALQEWIAKRGRQPGPLFSAVRRSGEITVQRLSGSAVARIVKRAAKSVGLDPALYAGHSMRRGCASSASAAGADILAIKARMRHKSIKTTEKYVDYASVFAVNPLKGVL